MRGWRAWRPLALALLSGVLAVLIYPNAGLWPLSFVALVPMLAAIEGCGGRRAFGLGMLMGLAYFGGSLSWLVYTMVEFGGMPAWLAWPVLALLAVYLAVYPALTCLLLVRTRTLGVPLPVRLAVFWVATEGLRGYLLTGFPWNLLGHGVHGSLRLIQLADLAGVYGLSFYLALFNGALYAALQASESRRRLGWVALCLGLLAVGALYGGYRLAEPLPERTVRLALVQHNAPQDLKWDAEYRRSIVSSLLQLSTRALSQSPDLIVWPEGATPFRFRYQTGYRKLVGDFVAEAKVPLLFGAPDKDPHQDRHFNSAFLLDTTGDIHQQYSKMQLVPFGEYVPLQSILFFVEKMADVGGNFYPGSGYTVFELGELRFGVFICFESVFGELVRHFAKRGAEFLVTLTNDAWFGETSGTSQHEMFLPFRAVETRRPVAQAAQSGYTAVYDQLGRRVGRTALLVQDVLIAEIHPADPKTWTLYVLLGNWLLYVCWVAAVGLVAEARRRGIPADRL